MTPRPVETLWGAALDPAGGARLRLWAPGLATLFLRANDRDRRMRGAGGGWFEIETDALAPGDAYSFVLPDGRAVPDPASRAQAGDVHGPSLLVDPRAYRWRTDWPGRPWEEAVIYELHVGTFTGAGTFAAARGRLPHLARLGVTVVELMPVAHFAGARGWGYDGVLPYAPHPAYGAPDDLKALIDAAHAEGLMVLLDVVHNHFGPEANHLHDYAPAFFDETRRTPWGPAMAWERPEVRRFFADNALYWLSEYNLDGLRFDAIDHIRDPSSPDILEEIATRARAELPGRPLHLTTEDERNVTHLHERDPSGVPRLYTAEWNDDFHNAAHVAATGETDGYYADFADDPLALLARALAEGFAFQGEPVPRTGRPRGEPSAHLPPAAFIDFLQNHDQIGNRALGERLTVLIPDDLLSAFQTVLLLSPHIPLIFMGEEFAETRPFLFFTDFEGELADAVRQGRLREFADFPAYAGHPEALAEITDPNATTTFLASKLDWRRLEAPEGEATFARLRELLALRRQRLVPRLSGAGAGTVLAAEAGALAVDWPLAGAAWRLRANLSDTPRPLPETTGELIHATHPEAGPEAPPRSVTVRLDETP
ncbi:MAG: malto-oligosyltrehalose trehalohydrolase [Pseudomonadota bacterium]